MENSVEKKLDTIETLLREINAKIDNFLGFETLSKEEKEEINRIRSEVASGEFDSIETVFEE